MGAPRRRLTLFAISSIFWRLIRQNTSKSVKIRFLAVPNFDIRQICQISSFGLVVWEWVIYSGRAGFAQTNWQSLQTFRTYQILTLQIRMLNFLCCFLFWDQIMAAPPGPGMMPGPGPDSRRTVALKSSSLPSVHCQYHSALKYRTGKQL